MSDCPPRHLVRVVSRVVFESAAVFAAGRPVLTHLIGEVDADVAAGCLRAADCDADAATLPAGEAAALTRILNAAVELGDALRALGDHPDSTRG